MIEDDRIRERAHRIWEEGGQPNGRANDHWERALRELEDEIRAGTKRRETGRTEVEAANIYVHRGPSSGAAMPGLESGDGLNTPGVAAQKPRT